MEQRGKYEDFVRETKVKDFAGLAHNMARSATHSISLTMRPRRTNWILRALSKTCNKHRQKPRKTAREGRRTISKVKVEPRQRRFGR